MSLQTLIKIQEDIYNRLSKAKSNFKKSPKDRITKQYVETRLENIQELWSQFTSTHILIIKDDSMDLNSTSYVRNDVYDKTETIYLDLKCELKTILSSLEGDIHQQPNKSISNELGINNMGVKLPKIVVPTFSGKYTEWPTFRDLFISLIDKNSSLAKVQKLHYLKSYLTGEAEQLLRHIPISECNYDKCWSQLETRYNNKKYLSHCILKRLLGQKNIQTESSEALKELMDTTSDCLGALSNLGIDISSWDIIIIHILTLKLDANTRKDWEINVTSNVDSDKLPTFAQFKEFLTGRYRAFEFLEPDPTHKVTKNNFNINKSLHVMITIMLCQFCKEEHKLGFCKQFSKQDIDTRRKFVQDNNLCFNCLGQNHSARYCRNAITCRICKRRHHSLLHPKNTDESVHHTEVQAHDDMDAEISYEAVEEQGDMVACFSKGHASQVLLATALVTALFKNGAEFTVRALLDQGSQASFVTEKIVQYLGLKKQPTKGIISGVGGDNNLISKSMVYIKIQSKYDPTVEFVVKAYVLKSITSLLPARKITELKWVEINNIPLADPQYHTPHKVDMLLGAEVYSKILQDGVKRDPGGTIIAQKTSLGWILSGAIRSSDVGTSHLKILHIHMNEDQVLRKFWELEAEPNNNKKIPTKEESWCEDLFRQTTTRNADGRYVVRLPFRNDDPDCQYGQSRDIALQRFKYLEAKLNKNIKLKNEYVNVINEYIKLGHMERVDQSQLQNKFAVYLPHHAVVRNDKDTTKVRVVFDASCKGKNGVSLNDDLLIGPPLQSELRHVLMRWRRHPICLVADVVKMYRQVRVAAEDTDFQRILWRENGNSSIQDYKLLTVTFGTASAPYLAVKAMQQVAQDEGDEFPLAAERVMTDYYMDDLMTGCENVDTGLKIYNEMNSLLAKGGFQLQKWSSNSDYLLKIIEKDYLDKDRSETFNIKQDEIIKTLGLTCNRCLDSFQYAVKLLPLTEPITKRKELDGMT
ncbi:unnamed protein product [Parnassius apollo]|uniref:(apollo) hypothetical protein n=1 Tax=Parnassius apollo TaxID=110799 RepID=A0A8S3XA40_PARAO|nr:unnamed protein product [Parnassius apollo]